MSKKLATLLMVIVLSFGLVACAVPEGEEFEQDNIQQETEEPNPFEEEAPNN